MECLHPFCPMGSSAQNWQDVVNDPRLEIKISDRQDLIKGLKSIKSNFGIEHKVSFPSKASKNRILSLSPCLFTQMKEKCSAEAIIHLCEISLGKKIVSANVNRAFDIQNPRNKMFNFLHSPIVNGASVGAITEGLCSEVLENEGIPHLKLDKKGWPIWKSPGHVSLNKGKLSTIKSYGDILIPAAPSNILISIKSEVARERLLVSGNRFESIGFGFFKEPQEFWTVSRINILKRMGFTAIYMPESTVKAIHDKLKKKRGMNYAVNINGTQLYRPLSIFGPDVLRIAGKICLDL